MGRAWACVVLLAGTGCASIRGTSELDEIANSGTEGDPDAGVPGDIEAPDDGDPAPGDGQGDGSDEASRDAGSMMSESDAGTSGPPDAGTLPEPDAGSTEPPDNATCSAPQRLSVPVAGGVVRVTANTTGAADSQAAACATPLISVPGPDHVYSFTMPFKGELEAVAAPSGPLGTFQPSVYVLGSCDDARSALACDYAGSVAFGSTGTIAAGTELFLYVDSGALTLAGVTTPAKGPYQLELALRKLVGDGQACGSGRTDPHCAAGLSCASEGVCRGPRCGDGTLGSNEQCDDGNTSSGDGCSATCTREGDTCAGAVSLRFVTEGSARVARVSDTTLGMRDDGSRACRPSAYADQFFTFTLTAASSVTVSVAPEAGFDPVLALYGGSCAALTQVRCRDEEDTGAAEEFSLSGVAAGTYTLVVDGYNDDGAYDLTVTIAP